MRKTLDYLINILYVNRYLSKLKNTSNFNGKIVIQFIASISFLVLSVINVITKSYVMLVFTSLGFAVNFICPIISIKKKNITICLISSILSCAILFALFAIIGGNDGFACLWIALFPFFAMAIMDLGVGFVVSALLQIFLIVIFWTPVRNYLLYDYTQQFCLRFPIFFFISFNLGIITTVSLQKNQYKAQEHLQDLEKITEIATKLSKYDSLTGLVNRRCAYEIFSKDYNDDEIPHTIVMGDLDNFKTINDTYGHVFGDEVLTTVSKYFLDYLPQNYIKSRWGGEEFLIAGNEPIDVFYEKIESLRLKVSQHDFYFKDKKINVTVTFGMAEYYKQKDLDTAIKIADDRLYLGKKTTKNCIIKQD